MKASVSAVSWLSAKAPPMALPPPSPVPALSETATPPMIETMVWLFSASSVRVPTDTVPTASI